MQKQKGFTIIELIVVIAIIAVLAAIVLVNVTSYINKGKDAAIQGDMASMLTNAADYMNTHNYYGVDTTNDFCNIPTAKAALAAADIASGSVAANHNCLYDVATPAAATPATVFCACSPMKGGSAATANEVFCVDSTGVKRVTTTGTAAAAITCAAECVSGVCSMSK